MGGGARRARGSGDDQPERDGAARLGGHRGGQHAGCLRRRPGPDAAAGAARARSCRWRRPYAAIGRAHGGWTDSVNGLVTTIPGLDGEIYGVPFAVNGNVLFRRNDVLEPAGHPDAPETWAELSEMAKAQTPPDNYGMAFALSNVGDGNLMTTILNRAAAASRTMKSKTCMIDSPETRAFMEWVTGAYAEGLFRPARRPGMRGRQHRLPDRRGRCSSPTLAVCICTCATMTPSWAKAPATRRCPPARPCACRRSRVSSA
ncbi:MAG: extracellular solute-binding protein [Chloroflexi bacterium]|nr:extracellular solute-binding protein [Chloroflexota bacterium]